MIESPFQIVSITQGQNKFSSNSVDSYHGLLEKFCNNSYGLYTQIFIGKISQQAESEYNFMKKLQLKKCLRRCVRKFMLTDLELVFVGYYCEMIKWDIGNKQIMGGMGKYQGLKGQQVEQRNLQLFLDLISYFVKFYIGKKQEYEGIQKYVNENDPRFNEIYRNWMNLQQKQVFCVSPRKINEIYGKFAKQCNITNNRKNYNNIVDTIIELSTSYSIIPNNNNKKILLNDKIMKGDQNQGNLIKNKLKINGIGQGLDGSSSIAVDNFGVENSRNHRKSSFIFESMHSLSRKSSQLAVENKKKSNIEIPVEADLQRSRQKKPGNKISLSFKSKQKPNSTVLGFIKQPTILQNRQQKQKGNNRSIQNNQNNQSKIENNNLSFLNLRSNRSSRSNSQLPFLWMPSQDGFFDRSKLN